MKNNFINLTEKQKDKPLFRVFRIERLLQVFTERKLTLMRTSEWDDPFENYIMNATGELEDGQPFSVEFRNHFFGQCWTWTRESDALWRIYAEKSDGARVSTTPRRLLKALYDQAGEFRSISSFIGEVSYLSTKKMLELIGDSNKVSKLILDQSGKGQALTLLIKRIPFRHENEVRLLYNSLGKVATNLVKFDVDANSVFDDLVFDPRMDYKVFSNYKQQLRALGYKGEIVKSSLYKIPNLKFRLKS